MAYNVSHTDGRAFATINEGTVNTNLGISLIGQNFNNYGQLIANNFISLLEHQANETPPLNPIAGQLWWDSKNKVLSFFDGDRFKSCSSSAVGNLSPIAPIDGDQWWDTSTHQLKIFTGTQWIVVGPSYTKYQNYYGMDPVTLQDAGGTSHNVAVIKVDGVNTAILNPGLPFEIAGNFMGFSKVPTGLTLASASICNGVAASSQRLNETYTSPSAYEIGSVVVFGGTYDVTTSGQYLDSRIAGVISEATPYTTAESLFFAPVVTLGKTRCKVTGPVTKGDILVNSTIPGVAMVLPNTNQWVPGCVIGKSLETSTISGIRMVSISVVRF